MSIDLRNDFVQSPLDLIVATASVTGATVCSTSLAAPSNTLNRNCIKRLAVQVAASGAQPPLFVGIFGGGATSSTPLALFCVTAASSETPSNLDLDNLHVLAPAGVATAIGTTAAPAASTSVAITAVGYVFGKQPATFQMNA